MISIRKVVMNDLKWWKYYVWKTLVRSNFKSTIILRSECIAGPCLWSRNPAISLLAIWERFFNSVFQDEIAKERGDEYFQNKLKRLIEEHKITSNCNFLRNLVRRMLTSHKKVTIYYYYYILLVGRSPCNTRSRRYTLPSCLRTPDLSPLVEYRCLW